MEYKHNYSKCVILKSYMIVFQKEDWIKEQIILKCIEFYAFSKFYTEFLLLKKIVSISLLLDIKLLYMCIK